MPSIPEIGNELDANYIIEGSLERQHGDVSILIRFIEASSDDHLWAEDFKGKWEEIFNIRADIAKKVASELKTMLTPYEIKQIETMPTEYPEAYEYYLKGEQARTEMTEE